MFLIDFTTNPEISLDTRLEKIKNSTLSSLDRLSKWW